MTGIERITEFVDAQIDLAVGICIRAYDGG